MNGQTCPDPGCPCARVAVHSRVEGRLRCVSCGATWVTRRGSPDFRLRHPRLKVEVALRMRASGVSVRAVAARLLVSPSTVQRWRLRASRV